MQLVGLAAQRFQPAWAVRAHLMAELGQDSDAARAFALVHFAMGMHFRARNEIVLT